MAQEKVLLTQNGALNFEVTKDYPQQLEFYGRLRDAIGTYNQNQCGSESARLANELYRHFNPGDKNTTFVCSTGAGNEQVFEDTFAKEYLRGRIETGVLEQNLTGHDFVIPLNFCFRPMEEKIQMAKYYLHNKENPFPTANSQIDWGIANYKERAEHVVAFYIADPGLGRKLEFDITHFREMDNARFSEFAIEAITEDIKARELQETNEFMNYLDTSIEVGLFTLLLYYQSTITDHQRIRKFILFLVFMVHITIPLIILKNTEAKYYERGFGLCTGDAPVEEKMAAIAIGIMYFVLSYLRFLSHGDPSDVYRSSKRTVQWAMFWDRTVSLILKELITISYFWILSAESDARSMIINSGALYLWLNLDSTAKAMFLYAFPPNATKMRESTKSTQVEIEPLTLSGKVLQRVVLGFRCFVFLMTVLSLFFVPFCKPDFSDEHDIPCITSSCRSINPSVKPSLQPSFEPSHIPSFQPSPVPTNSQFPSF